MFEREVTESKFSIHLAGCILSIAALAVPIIYVGLSGKYESIGKFWIFVFLYLALGSGPLWLFFNIGSVDELVDHMIPGIERSISFHSGLLIIWPLNILIYIAAIMLTFYFMKPGVIVI